MLASDDSGDFSYGRLRKWIHAPKSLIRQTIKYTLRYFGACIIQHDLNDQNVINEAVRQLYAARGMKPDSKLNIKKLPKLELEINYAKIEIHTQPSTVIELNSIEFCEKTKIIGDDKGFHFLAFVAKGVDSQYMAFIFVCSKEFATNINNTFTQLFEMQTLHTHCNNIQNAIRQIGCAPETSRHVQELWQSRDSTFRDAVHRVQVELTRQFPLLDESLQKLKDADAENENLQEHAKIIESMKQSLIQAVRYSQSVALDVDGLSSKQLESCLNPQPTSKQSLSHHHSQSIPMHSNDYDDGTLKATSSTPHNTSINVYETPRQLVFPSQSPLNSPSIPQLPNTPIPKAPIAYRTLPNNTPTHKKSAASSLFNTLKPKSRSKNKASTSETSKLPDINNLSINGNNNRPLVLEKNGNNANIPSESTYYEGPINTVTPTMESPYYEGTINSTKDQQESGETYYYCPRPGDVRKTSDQAGPSTSNHHLSAEHTEGSQSESSASQRNSIRESNLFEDEDPESVYITHQQFNVSQTKNT